MRRTVLVVLAALLVVLGAAGAVVAGGSTSSATRPRLERSLPHVFSELYAQRAAMLGRSGVTPASLHARAMCDKAGAEGSDVGPGSDWVCLMSWKDPEVPMPSEGYGKFELSVHSNDCYTASSPSKLTGFLTLTDTRGREVTNPVFEFDACFDPGGDDTATGVHFPSLLQVTSTTLTPDPRGRVGVQVSCGTGSAGCAGRIDVASGGTDLGTIDYTGAEESTQTLPLPAAVPSGAADVTLTVHLRTGVASSTQTTLPVQ